MRRSISKRNNELYLLELTTPDSINTEVHPEMEAREES